MVTRDTRQASVEAVAATPTMYFSMLSELRLNPDRRRRLLYMSASGEGRQVEKGREGKEVCVKGKGRRGF